MSAPNPVTIKNLILGVTSGLCEKLNKLLVGISTEFYNWISFEYNPDGQSLTDEYIALLCAAQCSGSSSGGGSGGGTENPQMPTPTGISASDGTFSTKVRVVWNAVTPPSGSVSQYLIYRSASDNTNAAGSTLIATVSGSTYSYDDDTITAGLTYNYWVKATNGTETSAYGGPDSGYATSFAETFPSVTDLLATQGFSETTSGLISLVFTAPDGTTSVDVYRNTSDDSSTAVLIHEDVVCNDTLTSQPTPADGLGINNSGGVDLLIYDQPPDGATKYYYWVKCKTSAPPQISGFSNSAVGWVQIGTGDTGAVGHSKKTASPDTIVVPGGCSKMRIVMRGGGGAGAGASTFFGAGGGAGGDTLLAEIDVTPGEAWQYDQYFVVNSSASSGNPPAANPLSGSYSYEGKASRLTRSSDSKVVVAVGGGSGLYSSSGGGIGGPAPGTSFIQSGISYWSLTVLKGKAGESASGTRGGRGGHSFGSFSTPPAHFLAGTFNGAGVENSGGGGSSVASSLTGGANNTGFCVVVFYP